MHFHDMRQLFQRIQDTGSRFAVNESHVSNVWVIAQVIVYIVYRYLFRFFKSKEIIVDMIIFGNISHTVTISTITANQKFIVLSDGSTDNCFHTISAATLQKYGSVLLRIASGNAYQLFTHFLHNVQVIILVPCTPVGHHGFFYGFWCGKRSGS